MKKQKINESISSTVFHFCPLSVMYQIAETNTFQLSNTGKYESDKRMNSFRTGQYDNQGKEILKEYPYYMCFSRTPLSVVGYQLMRINGTKGEWNNSLVRIEIDGDLLNANYKGAPVNFFTEKNPKGDLAKKYKGAQDWSNFKYIPNRNGSLSDRILFGKGMLGTKEMEKINPSTHKRGRNSLSKYGYPMPKVDYQELERNRLSEYEDRIFSNKNVIQNANRYIKRIDILLTKLTLSQKEVINMIFHIINKYGSNKVFIYDSQIAFNSMNIRNALNKTMLDNTPFQPLQNDSILSSVGNDTNVYYKIPSSALMVLSQIISMIAFTPNFSTEIYEKNIHTICNMLGLTSWKYYDGNIDYFQIIKEKCYHYLNSFENDTTGYRSTFPTFTHIISNYNKRYQGKKTLMSILEKLLIIGKKDALNFSQKFLNGKTISIQVATKNKYILYLNQKYKKENYQE